MGRVLVSSVSEQENWWFSIETITTSNANKMSKTQNLILNPPVKFDQATKYAFPLKNSNTLSQKNGSEQPKSEKIRWPLAKKLRSENWAWIWGGRLWDKTKNGQWTTGSGE